MEDGQGYDGQEVLKVYKVKTRNVASAKLRVFFGLEGSGCVYFMYLLVFVGC